MDKLKALHRPVPHTSSSFSSVIFLFRPSMSRHLSTLALVYAHFKSPEHSRYYACTHTHIHTHEDPDCLAAFAAADGVWLFRPHGGVR